MSDATEPTPATTVLLVDDDALVRSGLRSVLASADDLVVVGEAADGQAALQQVVTLRPAVVLMDIRMPGLDGISATESLCRTADPPAILILTTFDTDENVLNALRAGASGFVLKDTAPQQIIEAVRVVATGDGLLSPGVTRSLLDQLADPDARRRRARARAALDLLTDRERDVALAIADGGSNADVAAQLQLAVATVKAYLSRVLDKLSVTSRVQVAILVHESRS